MNVYIIWWIILFVNLMVLVSNYEDTRKEGKFNNFIVIRLLSLWVSTNAFIFIALVLIGVFELINMGFECHD